MMTNPQRIVFALEPTFEFLSDEYRCLYRDACATVFQSPLWLDHIHRRLAPALKAKQNTITARDSLTRELLAVFPMVIHKTYGVPAIQPADFDVCDYNAVVASSQVLTTLAEDPQLLAGLDALLGRGPLLLFRKVRADGFDYSRLFPRCRTQHSDSVSFHCDMDDDLEFWKYESLNRQASRKLEQLFRKLQREFPGAEFVKVEDHDLIVQAIECVRDCRVDRLDDDILRQQPYFDFYKNYALEAIDAGEASMFVVLVEGRVRAALFGLQAKGVFHGTLLGGDTEELGRYSLGIQCHFLAAQYWHGQGDRVYSLGPGSPDYKARFRAVGTTMINVTRSHSLIGAGVSALYHASFPFKDQIKSQVRRMRDQRRAA